MTGAAEARERAEWGRAAGLAVMVGGLFSGADPYAVIPARLRPRPADGPAESPELRAIRQETALLALDSFLRRG